MNKEFIPYEQALALKELGFNESCFGSFKKDSLEISYANIDYCNNMKRTLAPLYQQAFRWFREKYGIFSSIWCFEMDQKFFIEFGFGIHKFEVVNKEEAELECLKKLIEIVKVK